MTYPAINRLARALRRLGRVGPLVMGVVLVSGCVAPRHWTYERLVREFRDGDPTPYEQAEVAVRPPGTAPGTPPDPVLSEAAGQLAKLRQEWEQQLTNPAPAAPAFVDFGAPQYQPLLQAVASGEAAKQLAAAADLDLLLVWAVQANPGLAAARRSLKATLEEYPQALYLDGILHQYNAFTKQLETQVGPTQQQEMVTMSFPFPQTLTLKGAVATDDVRTAQEQVGIALRDLVTETKAAFYDYTYATEALASTRESRDLLAQMLKVAQTQLRSDGTMYASVLAAQSELAMEENELRTMATEQGTAIARLNALLNREPAAPLGPPRAAADAEVTVPLPEIYTTTLAHRPELQIMRLKADRMRLMVEMTKRMAYPKASLGASLFEDRMALTSGTGSTAPGTGAAAGMGMGGAAEGTTFMSQRTLDPAQVVSFGQSDAYARQLAGETEAMVSSVAAEEAATRAMVRETYGMLDTARRGLQLYRESLVPQAQQAVTATAAAYQSGKVSFAMYLETQRAWLKARLGEQRAGRDYRVNLARLEQLAGRPLPKQELKLP